MRICDERLTVEEEARALCTQVDPELFFEVAGGNPVTKRERAERAKALCRTCDIQPRCLEVALANDEPNGIWGGLDARERARLRREVA